VEGASEGKRLTDHQYDSGIKLTEGQSVITMTLDKPEDIQRVYLSMSPLKGANPPKVAHSFEALVGGKWQILRRGHISGMMPTIALKTKQVRLTLEVPKSGVSVDEVHLITPAPITQKSALSW
jgi:hypothetical protein